MHFIEFTGLQLGLCKLLRKGQWGRGAGGRATALWSLLWTIQDLVLAMSSYLFAVLNPKM